VRAAAAALLGFVLAGCAPAAQSAHLRMPASAPISQWENGENGADDDLDTTAPEDAASEPGAQGGTSPATAAPVATTQAADETLALAGLEPAVVHRARIEMARAALVEENMNKERVDLAEELQRELAALQASSQASKSRRRHGGPTKKQP
jgi:hypothetical protein